MKIILRTFCFLLLATFSFQENNESVTTVEPVTTVITLNASTTESSPSNSTLSTTIASTLESNLTQATTTPAPKEDVNATKEIKKTVMKNRGHLNTSDYNCECDLMLNICDLNCCCDIDCTNDMVTAFDCSKTEVNLADYYYGHGLQHCAIESELFCIKKHNYGDELLPMLTQHDSSNIYKWPEIQSQEQDSPRFDIENEYYVHGDSILIYDPKADNIDTIELPGSLTDTICQVKEPIKFLQNKSVRCLKSISDILKENSEFLKKLKGGRIFRKPLKTLTSSTDNDFLNVTTQVCKYSLENCTDFDRIENVTDDTEAYDECFQDTIVHFQYNHTSLHSMQISFISHDVFVMNSDVLEESNTKVVQKFVVEFLNLNQNLEHNFRKRQRGYNDEETLLATKLVLLNETLKDQPRVLEYFQKNLTVSNSRDFSLKIPVSKAGKCHLTKSKFDEIKFNENSLTMCRVSYAENHGKNATEFCRNYQKEIIRYLFNYLNITNNYTAENLQEYIMVSKYWNPQNETQQWVQVNLRNLPGSKVDVETTDEKIICKHLLSNIKYSIYSNKLRNHNKFENTIERIDAEFGGFTDKKVKIDEENHMKIQIFVQFFPTHSIKNCAQSTSILNIFLPNFFSILLMYFFLI